MPCTPSLLGASYSIWYSGGLPSRYTYDLTDIWDYVIIWSIRVSRLGTLVAISILIPWFIMIIWHSYYLLIISFRSSHLTYDIGLVDSWSLILLTDDIPFSINLWFPFSNTYIRFVYPFALLYICSLGILSSAAFLFLWQVLGWKLGFGEECIGALVDYPID